MLLSAVRCWGRRRGRQRTTTSKQSPSRRLSRWRRAAPAARADRRRPGAPSARRCSRAARRRRCARSGRAVGVPDDRRGSRVECRSTLVTLSRTTQPAASCQGSRQVATSTRASMPADRSSERGAVELLRRGRWRGSRGPARAPRAAPRGRRARTSSIRSAARGSPRSARVAASSACTAIVDSRRPRTSWTSRENRSRSSATASAACAPWPGPAR